MLAKLSIVAAVFILASCDALYPETMDCTFLQMAGTYQVTGKELATMQNTYARRPLIKVTRDGRTFMFRRDQLDACQNTVTESR